MGIEKNLLNTPSNFAVNYNLQNILDEVAPYSDTAQSYRKTQTFGEINSEEIIAILRLVTNEFKQELQKLKNTIGRNEEDVFIETSIYGELLEKTSGVLNMEINNVSTLTVKL